MSKAKIKDTSFYKAEKLPAPTGYDPTDVTELEAINAQLTELNAQLTELNSKIPDLNLVVHLLGLYTTYNLPLWYLNNNPLNNE
jgi:hypothetical protein